MTNKRDRRIVIITVIAIVVVGWFAYSTYMFHFHPQRLKEIKIFADFAELHTSLENVTISEENVTDKHIDSLLPVQQRCIKGHCDGSSFTMYAYEFSSEKEAKQYYKNVTDQWAIRSSSYLLSSPGKLTVIDQKSVYFIETNSIGDMYDIISQLYASYSKTLYVKKS